MRTLEESGFRVSVPESDSFRLADLEPYRELSGRHLKEMDLGWWDVPRARLLLLELKGREIWDEFDREREGAHAHLLASLETKANDVLLILAAVWSGTETGKRLAALLPPRARAYPGDKKLKLVFLVDTPARRRELLGPVKDALRNRLAGRLALFGAAAIVLADDETAMKMGLPVARL